MEVREVYFGATKNGEKVFKYILENDFKTRIVVLDYGCIVQSIQTADKLGIFADITLGYDSLTEYENDIHYMGAIVGRIANRVGNAQYIDGPFMVKLDKNAGIHHLHGGTKGLNTVVWKAKPIQSNNSVGVEFMYRSPDGENGYPGNVDFKVSYILNNKNQFMIYLHAETDKRSPINLTSHIYYNLKGVNGSDILGHYAMINALKYLEVSSELIPTGKANSVIGSLVNFSRGKNIGSEIDKTSNGYDHTFVINKEPGKFVITAKVVEPKSGRIIEITTDQPTLQFYTANNFDGSLSGKNSVKYVKHAGFCMETQAFPDAPNHSNFPSIFLNPGEKYSSHTQINFQVKFD